MEQGPVQNNIRARREALGLVQQRLAQLIGISRQALGAIEAIEAAGAVPGEDIKIVSIDAVKDGMLALIDGGAVRLRRDHGRIIAA